MSFWVLNIVIWHAPVILHDAETHLKFNSSDNCVCPFIGTLGCLYTHRKWVLCALNVITGYRHLQTASPNTVDSFLWMRKNVHCMKKEVWCFELIWALRCCRNLSCDARSRSVCVCECVRAWNSSCKEWYLCRAPHLDINSWIRKGLSFATWSQSKMA